MIVQVECRTLFMAVKCGSDEASRYRESDWLYRKGILAKRRFTAIIGVNMAEEQVVIVFHNDGGKALLAVRTVRTICPSRRFA